MPTEINKNLNDDKIIENEPILNNSTEERSVQTKTDNEAIEEMIPKSSVDEYIKTKIAEEYKKTSERNKIETDARRMVEDDVRKTFVDTMKNSPEPWVELVSFRVDDRGMIRTEIEWNDAFIARLREEKYEGITEEELIQKWILMIMASTAEEIAS